MAFCPNRSLFSIERADFEAHRLSRCSKIGTVKQEDFMEQRQRNEEMKVRHSDEEPKEQKF